MYDSFRVMMGSGGVKRYMRQGVIARFITTCHADAPPPAFSLDSLKACQEKKR